MERIAELREYMVDSEPRTAVAGQNLAVFLYGVKECLLAFLVTVCVEVEHASRLTIERVSNAV